MDFNTLIEIFKSAFFQTLFFIFLVAIAGFIFSYIEKINRRILISSFGYRSLIITGILGTVVHELSHMFFCVVFRHKIRDFSLYRPFSSQFDGIMGYVNHSWNNKSIYQKTGNVFIGIAPIVFGTFTMLILMKYLIPEGFSSVVYTVKSNVVSIDNFIDYNDIINSYISIMLSVFVALNPFNQGNILMYIIFLVFMYSIATHMELSKEDIKNSSMGIIFLVLLIFFSCILSEILGGIVDNILIGLFLFTVSILTFAISFAMSAVITVFIISFPFSRN